MNKAWITMLTLIAGDAGTLIALACVPSFVFGIIKIFAPSRNLKNQITGVLLVVFSLLFFTLKIWAAATLKEGG